MYKKQRILGLIPARGGSKRLPHKNIIPLLGKPLIAWTIEQALKSKYLDRVIVSTDSEIISKISKQFGAEVPFVRPQELSKDTSLSVDVVLHALEFLYNLGDNYDCVALLEPTSPLRKLNDIDQAIESLINHPIAINLVSVGNVHLEHPKLMKKIQDGFVIPFFDLSKMNKDQKTEAYFPYGVIYLSKTKQIFKNRNFYAKDTLPFFIERWQNYEIDDETDFLVIEKIMQNNFSIYKKGNKNG